MALAAGECDASVIISTCKKGLLPDKLGIWGHVKTAERLDHREKIKR